MATNSSKVTLNPDTERAHTLLRQVNTATSMNQNTESELGSSISKMMTVATQAQRCQAYVGWCFAILAGFGLPVTLLFFGDVIDSANPNKDPKEAVDETFQTFLLFLYVGLGIWFTCYMYYAMLLQFQERAGLRFKKQYLEAILKQESSWFDMNNYMEMSARLNKEGQAFQRGIGMKLGGIIMPCSMSLAGFAIGFSQGWNFAFVVLGGAPIIFISFSCFTAVLELGTTTILKAYGQSAGYAEQALGAIKVVSAFGMEEKESENYERYLERARIAGKKHNTKLAFGNGFIYLGFYFMYAYSFFMGAVFINKGYENHTYGRIFTPGDVMTIFFGVAFGSFALGGAAPNAKSVKEGQIAAKTAFEVIDRVPAIPLNDSQAKFSELRGEIQFKNVEFYYPSRPEQKILQNFSAKFELGKTTALVGPSGSGKSTVVQLIERFYDANSGEVLIDNQDIKELNLRHMRRQIGYVGQEPVLFNTTIRKNMLMGNPEASDDQIIEALQKANAWDFLQKKNGLDMEVGSQGGALSGGQKQRIALARAFLKKPKLLIFDEATSALDKKNEQVVQKAIENIQKELQVTCVVIAHRLSTIINADKILVLEKGQLVEEGNHNSLLRDFPSGIYAKYVEEQKSAESNNAQGEIEEINIDDDVDEIPEPNLQKSSSSVTKANLKLNQEEMKKLEDANDQDKVIEEQEKTIIDGLKSGVISKKLSPMAKPTYFYILAIIFAILTGLAASTAAIWIIYMMFSMMIPDKTLMWDNTGIYALCMLGTAFALLLFIGIMKTSFGIIGENITYNLRRNVYASILSRPPGWFDSPDHQAGVMTTLLSSDIQMINGASTEAAAVTTQAMCTMLAALIISMYYCWQVSLTCFALSPLLMIGGYISSKIEMGMLNDKGESEIKAAQIMAGDVIINYKTVASLGYEDKIIESYNELLQGQSQANLNRAHGVGFAYGFSQFMINLTFGLLFWLGQLYVYLYTLDDVNDDGTVGNLDNNINPFNSMLAIFVMIFGAMEAGQANQFGTDMGKASVAAKKVFTILEIPSKVNPVQDKNDESKKKVDGKFQGEIEFKDVWFRYPNAKEQWIFKGLNLKINAKDRIAIVGASGQGKSTFVSLVLRFYDINFGQILIDGKDIKTYDIDSLRKSMGYVMQEPLLFNYTIRENILYGNQNASNEEIRKAAQIANAAGFIEGNSLDKNFDDSPATLFQAMQDEILAPILIEIDGQENYDKKLGQLKKLVKKEEKEGKFVALKDQLDSRSDSQKGNYQLHSGYDLLCGNRGSKLSGGQKQRIAIARAVIRQPKILLLDEATSALDEESQRLVQQALEDAMEDRTAIVIAHRLTTVEKCTRIAVIENGKIIEEGSFSDLKNQGGYFASLANGMSKDDGTAVRQ